LLLKHFACGASLVTVSWTVTVFANYMTRINIKENTWDLSEENQAKLVNFLDRGWGRVLCTPYSIALRPYEGGL
jgi:hypothetical protein